MVKTVSTCITHTKTRGNLAGLHRYNKTPDATKTREKLAGVKNMSLLELGPIIFGGTEKIIQYLRRHALLARQSNCDQ